MKNLMDLAALAMVRVYRRVKPIANHKVVHGTVKRIAIKGTVQKNPKQVLLAHVIFIKELKLYLQSVQTALENAIN